RIQQKISTEGQKVDPFQQKMTELPPFAQAIGMELLAAGERYCTVRVPYAPHLVGDPDTGILHGGVITATLDNASGWAVRCHEDWAEGVSMATLDIRIDYMKAATPKLDLIVEAECYQMGRSVAFVRALAHQGDRDKPVATSMGAFMLGTSNVQGRNL
ncbi:MAG: hypothetical protein ACJAYE_003412, partial [Candidatus Azotimanducaceae bacterium]